MVERRGFEPRNPCVNYGFNTLIRPTNPIVSQLYEASIKEKSKCGKLSVYAIITLMKAYISQLISDSLRQISPEEAEQVLSSGVFDVSFPKAEMGDYSTNAAMVLFKKFNTAPAGSPAELAQIIAAKILELDGRKTFARVESVGGFINFVFSSEYLYHNLQKISEDQNKYGTSDMGLNQKILLEYFQPNMAKPLHLGHLRTAIIGDSLFRILRSVGFNVQSDTHLGDWGTQFGLLLLAYKTWGDTSVIEKDPIAELNKLYVKINGQMEAEPELREAGKQEFAKLEKGDNENLELWKKFREWSWQEYNIIYDDLGVRKSDHDWPESFFVDKMPAVIDLLKEAGLLIESQGAQIVNLEDHGLGVAVVIKSDGATTYLLRDLATYIYRKEQGFEKQIYVVDNRQSHTLNQTFKILELLGIIQSPDEAVHIAYGFLSLPDGAMSTRKGTVIGANELITKAKEQALAIIEEKNPGLSGKEDTAKLVMQSAIKYFDLSHNYRSDIIFTWEKALSFEGNTGPYLQYTHARINGILRKAGISETSLPEEIKQEDMHVMRKLCQYPDVVESSAKSFSPNIICNYLFELSQVFNTFYEASPVLKEEDLQQRNFRVSLIRATAQVLSNGLGLLGITAPEEM